MAATPNGRQNGVYTYDSFGGNKKQADTNFLWWCSGAYQPLLKEYPTEHTRYAGLGGVVLATFVLAAISSGYAIYSVFDNWLWAAGFGIIWGLIIFNLDRFLVSTMRKYGVSSRKQLWMAFPRFILALLIGVTISRPLELKIFEKEINTKITENLHKKILLNDSLLEAENKNAVSAAQKERSEILQRKSAIEDTLHRLQQSYLQEADGTGGSLHRGIEKLTLLKQEAYNSSLLHFTPELLEINNKLHYQDSLLNNAKSDMEVKQKQFEAKASSDIGFLERNKALSDLAGQENSVFWADFFISLLIILIEIGPVLSKLIMSVGPYDIALAKTELMQMASSENDMRKDKELVFEKQKEIYEKKKEISVELIEKLQKLQKKHIEEEIEKWERGEKNISGKTPLNDLIKQIRDNFDYKEENIL
jgi:hypothetical protein